MAEYKLFEGETPYVSTAAFHAHRERAPHLEQEAHQERLFKAAQFVSHVPEFLRRDVTVSDLGCGDGGLLSLVQSLENVSSAWGYDFQPSNEAGWRDRGVNATLLDAFGVDQDLVEYGDVTVMTEVLEHLADPHGVVRRVYQNSKYLVASSPYDESDISHDECHAWAWDVPGYKALLEQAGYRVIRHEPLAWKFQVIMGVRP